MIWKEQALEHAKKEDPKESVGLLVNIKGKEKYIPCKNLSSENYDSFILDPKDYIKANNLGNILAVIHSHPKTPPIPSQADLVSCEKSGFVWHIVNPKTETWGFCKPSGYKAPFFGREWVWGITDCWSLVRDWYEKEKNIVLRDWQRPTTPEEFLADPMFERCAWRTGFRKLRPDENLETGDLLFMSILGKGLNHVAIFYNGEVIHHLADRLSCKEPYSEWLLKCTGGRYRYAS